MSPTCQKTVGVFKWLDTKSLKNEVLTCKQWDNLIKIISAANHDFWLFLKVERIRWTLYDCSSLTGLELLGLSLWVWAISVTNIEWLRMTKWELQFIGSHFFENSKLNWEVLLCNFSSDEQIFDQIALSLHGGVIFEMRFSKHRIGSALLLLKNIKFSSDFNA